MPHDTSPITIDLIQIWPYSIVLQYDETTPNELDINLYKHSAHHEPEHLVRHTIILGPSHDTASYLTKLSRMIIGLVKPFTRFSPTYEHPMWLAMSVIERFFECSWHGARLATQVATSPYPISEEPNSSRRAQLFHPPAKTTDADEDDGYTADDECDCSACHAKTKTPETPPTVTELSF